MPYQRGVDRHCSKLTEADVRQIRAGMSGSMAEIGKLFGVSAVAIWKVIHNKTWRHVT